MRGDHGSVIRLSFPRASARAAPRTLAQS